MENNKTLGEVVKKEFENIYKQGCKDTAEKIFRELIKRAENISFFDCRMGLDLDELAKQFGVEVEE